LFFLSIWNGIAFFPEGPVSTIYSVLSDADVISSRLTIAVTGKAEGVTSSVAIVVCASACIVRKRLRTVVADFIMIL
jgi:hypothetical protein